MLAMNLITLVACGMGFLAGWRIVRRGRLPFESEDALLSWKEHPAAVFHYDKLGGFLITVHALATMTLCVLLVCSVNRAGASPISMAFESPASRWLATVVGLFDTQVPKLSAAIAALSAGIGGFAFGKLWSFPVSRWCIRPVLVHLHPEGIIYGQNGSQWQTISSYQVDRDRRLIKLFTYSRSGSPTFALHPPSDALFIEAESKMRDLLPDKKTDVTSPRFRQRWLSALLFCLTMLLLLLGAFWIYQHVAEWVWFLYAVGIVGFVAGGRVLLHI